MGVIAVDPTSPFTGGAVLGDRVRMQRHNADPGVFIRSMGTRGHLGGLSRGTAAAVDVLDAAGYDYVLVETVGVGQSEIEISSLSDLVVLLNVPGLISKGIAAVFTPGTPTTKTAEFIRENIKRK